MIATDTYAEADMNARSALSALAETRWLRSQFFSRGPMTSGSFRLAIMLALMLRDLHMFAPAPHRSP